MPKQLKLQFYRQGEEPPEVDLPIAFWVIYSQLETLLGEPIDHYEYEHGSQRLEEVIGELEPEDVKVYSLHIAVGSDIGFDTAASMRLRVWVDLFGAMAMRVTFPGIPVGEVSVWHAERTPEVKRSLPEQVANFMTGVTHHVAQSPQVMIGPMLQLDEIGD
jgi:hypothetical protein